jgi:hypothetical protein
MKGAVLLLAVVLVAAESTCHFTVDSPDPLHGHVRAGESAAARAEKVAGGSAIQSFTDCCLVAFCTWILTTRWRFQGGSDGSEDSDPHELC